VGEPQASNRITLTAYPNKYGFLGRTETQVEARSFAEAMQAGYGAASSLLSVWSVQLDTPLEISDMGGTDLVSKTAITSVLVPFPEKPFVVPAQGRTSPEFRA
jgi:hypothetical protein